MAEIPSWLWLVAGAIVVGGSLYVRESLQFFFYVGLLFIVMGIAKVTIKFITRKSSKKHEKKEEKKHAQHTVHPHYNQCACGQWVRKTDNFCWHCGRRLR